MCVIINHTHTPYTQTKNKRKTQQNPTTKPNNKTNPTTKPNNKQTPSTNKSYGLKILSVYMKGSMNMSYDSSNLTTPDIKWLGVRPSDLDRFSIPEQCRLPMTEEDIKTGKKLVRFWLACVLRVCAVRVGEGCCCAVGGGHSPQLSLRFSKMRSSRAATHHKKQTHTH